MKSLKLSLAAIVSLGALGVAEASTFKDAFENTTLSGFTRVRYTYQDGANNPTGQSFQLRTSANVKFDLSKGWGANTGFYFNAGSGVPLNGYNNILNSTPGFQAGNAGTNISIKNLNLFKTFENTKTTVTLGAMYIDSPINDSGFDRGVGGKLVSDDLDGITIKAMMFGNTALDSPGGISYGNGNFVNTLTTIGLETDPSKLSGIDGKIYYSYISSLAQFVFAELGYNGTANEVSFGVTAQAAYASFFDNAKIAPGGATAATNIASYIAKGELAKERLVFSIQADVSAYGFAASIGYNGSGAQGYGAMQNYAGAFNMGGQVWWDMGDNGYGIWGAGTFKGTTINVAYANLSYNLAKSTSIPLSVKLALAYIDGHNDYGKSTHLDSTAGAIKLKPGYEASTSVSMMEITPSITYAVMPNLKATLLYSNLGGKKIDYNKTSVTLQYSF